MRKLLFAVTLLSLAFIAPVSINAQGLDYTSGAAITAGNLVKLNSSGQAVNAATTDTSGVVGVALSSATGVGIPVFVVGATGLAVVVNVDNACAPGNFVSISSTVNGKGHCTAAPIPVQSIGVALTTTSGASLTPVLLGGGTGGGGAAATASAFDHVPTACSSQAAQGVDASGNAVGCLPILSPSISNTFTALQNFDANIAFKGPNPHVSVTRYNVRSTATNVAPMIPGITANCTSGLPAVALSSASTFQNGDGVTLFGCGAAHSMTTPAAPTVTPSVSSSLTGTGNDVNGPTGATTYNYKIVALNGPGGFTAASAAGTTATGAASLGFQTVGITSMTRSGQTVTVTTSAAHGLTVGSMMHISGVAPGDFGGWFIVATVADTTHFTYTNGMDTAAGALAAATSVGSGAVGWWNDNRITLPALANGAIRYAIYSDRGSPGTFNLIGLSDPLQLFFQDYGQTMMGGQLFPYYLPATAPASASNNSLTTTIVSGAGTTALTLNANAGATVSGATILFDNAPNILAAATAASNAGLLYFPANGTYVINSYLDLSSLNGTVSVAGNLFLNDTVQIGSNSKWYGNLTPVANSATSFAWEAENVITVSHANPAFYAKFFNSALMQGLQFNYTGVGQHGIFIADATNAHLDHLAFAHAINDYMGIDVTLVSGLAGDVFFNEFDYLTMNTTQGLNTSTPVFACLQSATRTCGWTKIENTSLSGRGLYYEGAELFVDGGRIQAGSAPAIGLNNGPSNNTTTLVLGRFDQDTMAQPLVANFAGTGIFAYVLESGTPSTDGVGVPGSFTGKPFGNIVAPFGVTISGQNVNFVIGPSPGTVRDGVLCNLNCVPATSSGAKQNSELAVGPTYAAFIDALPMAAPTCAVSVGGTEAIGSFTFTVAPVWQNNGESLQSLPSSTCTTTTGNQTITVSWVAASGNPKGYSVYSNGNLTGATSSCSLTIRPGTSAVLDGTEAAGCSGPPSISAGGPTILMPGTQGMATPALKLTGVSLTGVNSGNVTVTIGSNTGATAGTAVAAGTSQSINITVTGATTTDVAQCSTNAVYPASWLTGITVLPPAISSANTVTLTIVNPTAASITPVAQTFRCTVTR